MSKICENCGKGIMRGNNVSHAKNRSAKIYHANLKKCKIGRKSILLCMDCRSKIKKLI